MVADKIYYDSPPPIEANKLLYSVAACNFLVLEQSQK